MVNAARLKTVCMTGVIVLFTVVAGPGRAEPMTFIMEPFPPFVIDKKGAPAGPFPDTVRAVCDTLNMPCKLEIYPWRRAYLLAEQGMVDGIFVLLRTPEREKDFHFTDNVFETSYAVFARQEETLSYAEPRDLSGYTVAVYGPSGTSTTTEDVIRHATTVRLNIEVDNTTVLRKLAAGRYGDRAVAVVNMDVGLYLIKHEKIKGLKIIGSVRKIDYAIGLSRKRMSREQADQFNDGLRELARKGMVRSIAAKYGIKPAS